MAEAQEKVLIQVEIQANQAAAKLVELKAALEGTKETFGKNSREVKALNAEIRTQEKVITNSEKAAKANRGSYDQLSASYSVIKQKLNEMSDAERSGTKEGQALEAQAKKTYEQMSNMQKATGVHTLDVGKYELAMAKLPGVFGEFQSKGSAALSGLQSKFKAVSGTLGDFNTALKSQTAAMEAAKIAAAEAAAAETLLKEAEIAGTVPASLAAAAEEKRAIATEASTAATLAGATAMNILKVALASSGIGLIVLALGSVVTYFKSTNEGAKKFAQIMATVGQYTQEFLKIAGAIGGVLFDSFSKGAGIIDVLAGSIKNIILPIKTLFILFNDIKNGDWAKAALHAKDAFIEMGKNFKQMGDGVVGTVKQVGEASAGIGKVIGNVSAEAIAKNAAMMAQVKKDRQKLAKEERNWEEERITLLGQRDVLEKKASKESALSAVEKVKAAKEAERLTLKVFSIDLEHAKENLRLTNLEQDANSKKDYQAIADAKNKVAELKAVKDNEIQTIANKQAKAQAAVRAAVEEKKKQEAEDMKALLQSWDEQYKAQQALVKDAYAMIGALDDERISKLKSDSKLALEEIEKDTALSEDQKFLYTAQVQRNLQKEIEKIQQEAAKRKIDLATGNIEDALRVELLKVAGNEHAKLELEVAAEKQALDKILELKGANQEEQDAIDEAALVKKNSIKQKEIALDSLTYATQLNLALDNEEKIFDIKLDYLNKEIEANKANKDKVAELEKQKTDLVKAENQKKIDAAFQMADAIGGALSALNQLQAAEQAGEEQRLDEKATADKERIDKLESDGVLTKEQADKRRADSDKALDKEKKKLALEAAKREKKMSYFSAVLSTASGVANALTVKPAFLIPAFLSLAAITGALQIATIAKTPLPKAARGKYINGNSHARGGVKIEAEGGEVIINKHSTRKYLPLLSAINEEGGGVSFMPKAANGMYVNDGGFSARSEAGGVDMVGAIAEAFSQINIFTAVTDINREQGKQSKVVQSGII